MRLAVAFDPKNDAYREGLVEVVQRANELRARQLVREAEELVVMRRASEALACYEEALHVRPHDPELNHTTAHLAFAIGKDLRKAKEYAARACEVEPEGVAHHVLLGRIYKAANLTANARREFDIALRLEPKNETAKAELKELKRW